MYPVMRGGGGGQRIAAPYIRTPDQETNEQLMREYYAADKQSRESAQKKARDLLISFLTPEQRTEFEAKGWFSVVGKSGRRYRVRRGTVANIDMAVNDNIVPVRLCVHPGTSMPVEDVMLSQLLHLQHDDMALVNKANHHPGAHGDTGWLRRA